jgi:lysophospholipase L1-like esterase
MAQEADPTMTAASMKQETRQQGRSMLAQLATVAAAVVACLLALDLVLRLVLPRSGIVDRTVDIQTPSTLHVKLEALRRFKGLKIAVLGDSLVFGRTMRDHGDADWQSHTLARQLEHRLAAADPARPVMVANLGMNGTLPSDLDQLVRIVTALQPDLVVFDLSLRSFSRDFERAADSQTRAWLADLTIAPNGRYATTAVQASLGRRIGDLAVNTWYLYRLKDYLQSLLFEGQPVAYLTQVRNRFDAALQRKPAGAAASPDGFDALVLAMKARARYAKIDLAADNPQAQALERLLQRLKTAGQPALAFYATEKPQALEELIERRDYDALQAKLAALMATAGPTVSYIGPQSIYQPSNFLDHVHLDQDGYRRLADHLAPAVRTLLARRSP